MADAHSRVTLVPRSGSGPNALDFHLSFYLGYVAAKHPVAELVVVANDKGYDPMIAHTRLRGLTAKHVGYNAKPIPVTKVALAKKAVAINAPAPAKKASTPAKAKPVTAALAVAPNLEAKTFARIQKGLVMMGNKAPHKLKPFLRHVGALLGKGSTAEQIDAVVAKLEAAGGVRVAGDLVLYSL